MDYVGIDLGCSALSTQPSSAVAVFDAQGRLREPPPHFRRSAELIDYVGRFRRDEIGIAVDAPRSVPDWTRENYARRSCETALQRHSKEHVGSFAGVASLYVRWYEIESRHFADVKVIETYPRAVWARLGLPFKPKDYKDKSRCDEIRACIEGKTAVRCDGFSPHQVDAVLCAFTAWCYGRGEVEWHGKPGEGLLIMPSPGRPGRPTPGDERIDETFRSFSTHRAG